MTRWIVRLHRLLLVSDVAKTFLIPAAVINIGNAAAYLFQVVLGRTLDVTEFGAFNATFSALLILTAPANVLPLVVAQATMAAATRGEERRLLGIAVGVALILAGFLTALGLLFSALYGRRFDIGVGIAVASFTIVVFSCLHPVTVGMMQARRRYVPAAFVVGGNPLLRFAFGLLLVAALGGGSTSAMWSVALPVALTFLLGLVFLRDLATVPSEPLSGRVRQVLTRNGWRQALSVTLLTVISNVDVVLARVILPEHAAGLYAGAAVVSRIGLLLPSALATIIFTEAARVQTSGKRGTAWHGILATAVLAGALAVVFVAGGETIMRHMLGSDFEDAGSILRLTGTAMCLLSVAQAAIMALAGRGEFGYLGALAGICLTMIALAVIVPVGASGLATLLLVCNAALCLAMVSKLLLRSPRSVEDAGSSPLNSK